MNPGAPVMSQEAGPATEATAIEPEADRPICMGDLNSLVRPGCRPHFLPGAVDSSPAASASDPSPNATPIQPRPESMMNAMADAFAHHPELRDKIADPSTSFFRNFRAADILAQRPELAEAFGLLHSDVDREASRREAWHTVGGNSSSKRSSALYSRRLAPPRPPGRRRSGSG